MAKTPADYQRTYREKQQRAQQRITALASEAHVLCRSVRNAAESGNPLAKEVSHKSDSQILRDLASAFEGNRIAARRHER